jgi:hypothetical protein
VTGKRPARLPFALPKEKSSIFVTERVTPTADGVLLLEKEDVRRQRRSSFVGITSVGCDRVDALPRECGIRLTMFTTAASFPRLDQYARSS